MYIEIEIGLGGGGGLGYLIVTESVGWFNGVLSALKLSTDYLNPLYLDFGVYGTGGAVTETNESDEMEITITPTLYAAKATDLTFDITFYGGASQEEGNEHFTLAGGTVTNTALLTSTVETTIPAGSLTPANPVTLTVVNNPSPDGDRSIRISSPLFGAATLTIVEDDEAITLDWMGSGMTYYTFSSFLLNLFKGDIDFDTATKKARLLTDSYTYDASDEYVDDLSNEVSGGSYERQTVAVTTSVPAGDTMAVVTPTASTVLFSAVPGTAQYLVFYDHQNADDSTNPLICCVDLEAQTLSGKSLLINFTGNIIEGVV